MKLFIAAALVLVSSSAAADFYGTFGLYKGYDHSQGVTTNTVGLEWNDWFLDLERYGGDLVSTTTAVAGGYNFTPGWKPFGQQPVLTLGVSYTEDVVRVPSRPLRPLVSERWTFLLGVSLRFGSRGYVDVVAARHNSVGGGEFAGDPFSANTGIDRAGLRVRAPVTMPRWLGR